MLWECPERKAEKFLFSVEVWKLKQKGENHNEYTPRPVKHNQGVLSSSLTNFKNNLT